MTGWKNGRAKHRVMTEVCIHADLGRYCASTSSTAAPLRLDNRPGDRLSHFSCQPEESGLFTALGCSLPGGPFGEQTRTGEGPAEGPIVFSIWDVEKDVGREGPKKGREDWRFQYKEPVATRRWNC
jgi:hypothetical protein